MRYLFLSLLLYSSTVDMRQAYRQYCLAGFKISMTQEERENLISGFLSANAGNTDVNTTRMLNMLVESLAYSKLQELLPEVQKQSPPAQSKEKKKLYLKFTKKELEQMTAKYKQCLPTATRSSPTARRKTESSKHVSTAGHRHRSFFQRLTDLETKIH